MFGFWHLILIASGELWLLLFIVIVLLLANVSFEELFVELIFGVMGPFSPIIYSSHWWLQRDSIRLPFHRTVHLPSKEYIFLYDNF